MSRLQDVLESCLRSMDEGQSLDSVLSSNPDLAGELRPLLEASALARAGGRKQMSSEALRRGRIRVLQSASELRARKTEPARRFMPAWSRLAVSLGLVVVLALTSTGLVSASSGALPGDQLYTVKRSWEDVQLFLVLQPQDRQVLISQFDQERLDEIDLLLGKGRAEPISFSGLVMHQQDGSWLVSGIRVSVTGATRMPSKLIGPSEPVTITGFTRVDGTVEAEDVQLLEPGTSLPPLEPSDNEERAPATGSPSTSAPSGSTATGGQVTIPGLKNPSYEFSGVVQSMQGSTWKINGQLLDVSQAEITGSAALGSSVKFEGYYSEAGAFAVTKITVTPGLELRGGNGSGDSGLNSGRSDGSGGAGSPGGTGGTGEGDHSGDGGSETP
jgi:uncharacterized membrane protein YgcG